VPNGVNRARARRVRGVFDFNSLSVVFLVHATVPETERNATNVAGEGATPSGGTRIEGLSHGLRCVYPRGAARVRTERCPRPLFPYADVQDELGFQVRAAGCNSLSACQSLQRLLGRRVAHTHDDDGSIPSAATTRAGFLSARRESRGAGFPSS
jgi:hypothetical protein